MIKNIEKFINLKYKFGEMRKINLNKTENDVVQVGIKAQHEFHLRQSLADCETKWKRKKLSLENIKERGVTLIKGIPTFFSELEESINLLNTNLTNKYAVVIKDGAEALRKE